MRTTLATVVLALVCGVASAQTLAHCIPDDVLFYARSENPMKVMEDLAESPLLWKQPQDFHTRFIDGMDRLMSMADGFIGIEVGSMSTYLNSVTAAEGALFGLELTDSIPEIDFVLVLDTPQADRIYNVFSGILVKKELAERYGDSEIDVSVADEFTARIGRYGDKIIVASRPERLREVMDRIGSVMPGSLAQSKSFKACVDSIEGPGCMYMNLAPILELIHEEIPSRQRQWFDGVASPLGFWKMAAAGWREGENSSRAALKMGEKVAALDMFAGPSGPPDLLGLAPSDAAIAVCWPGELAPVWRKSSAFFLDASLFPYADRAEEGIRSLQKMLGFRFDEIAELASGGMLACFVPTVLEVDDDEAWLGVLRVADGARAQEMALSILEKSPGGAAPRCAPPRRPASPGWWWMTRTSAAGCASRSSMTTWSPACSRWSPRGWRSCSATSPPWARPGR